MTADSPFERSLRASSPEKLLIQELWEFIYAVPNGVVAIEHIRHAFYMAANYGFQIVNDNFAPTIGDHELYLRFMNDSQPTESESRGCGRWFGTRPS